MLVLKFATTQFYLLGLTVQFGRNISQVWIGGLDFWLDWASKPLFETTSQGYGVADLLYTPGQILERPPIREYLSSPS